ncbi:MAG: TIGR04283 family arsenosugar biosynthesis glycosyltransferase [Paracoccaceae bacterium]
MVAPLSVVIPTLDAEQELPDALQCLMEGVSAGLVRELVISDGGSRDATLAIADAAGAVVVSGPAGRGGQLRRGAAVASGQWMLFLHADTHLAAGWVCAVEYHIRQSEAAAVFKLRFRADGIRPRIVAGWANLRSKMGLPYGDQGLLISREFYDKLDGYPDIPLMEDVAMARKLHRNIRLLSVRASTSAHKYIHEGWLRRGARNLLTLMYYLAGVAPEKLVSRYQRRGSI